MLVTPVVGNPSAHSRSGVPLERARDWLGRRGVEVASHQVLDFPVEDLLHAHLGSPSILALTEQVDRADDLLVAAPVYKTSFSGALKVLLDLLSRRTLEHKVVLPFTTGGSSTHMLAVNYTLRPILTALKAQEVLHGVLVVDKQIIHTTESDPVRLEPVLEQRLENVLGTLHLALSRRPQSISPQLLSKRLVNTRWSI